MSGAYGGMTPKGELLAHFFTEYIDVPSEIHVPLDKKGRLKPDESVKIRRVEWGQGETVVRRDLKVGLIIPAHVVNIIATWMLDKLKSSGIEVETVEEKVENK